MKNKLNSSVLVNIVIIGFIIVTIGWFLITTTNTQVATINHPLGSTIISEINSDMVKPIDADIPDTISYKKYKEMKDSIRTIREYKNGVAPGGDGMVAAFIGTSIGESCDTCGLATINTPFEYKKHTQYYLVLPGWKIKSATTDWGARHDDSVKFYVEHGQGYVRKAINTNTKIQHGVTFHTQHIKDIPVKFRYDDKTQYLMIPVSGKTHNIASIAVGFIFISFGIYAIFLFTAFFKFIIDLSRGLAFTDQNIRRLLFIALTLIISPVVILVLNLLMRLLFNSYFMPDVILNTAPLKDSWQGIATGLVFLLLYKAFRQGKKLKEEQELTI